MIISSRGHSFSQFLKKQMAHIVKRRAVIALPEEDDVEVSERFPVLDDLLDLGFFESTAGCDGERVCCWNWRQRHVRKNFSWVVFDLSFLVTQR